MPDLQQALAEKELADKAAAEQEAAQQETETQRKIAEQLGHYERLLANNDFQWFLDALARPRIKVEHDAALDVKKPIQDRGDHAQRHDILFRLIDELETTRTKLRNQLEQMAKKA